MHPPCCGALSRGGPPPRPVRAHHRPWPITSRIASSKITLQKQGSPAAVGHSAPVAPSHQPLEDAPQVLPRRKYHRCPGCGRRPTCSSPDPFCQNDAALREVAVGVVHVDDLRSAAHVVARIACDSPTSPGLRRALDRTPSWTSRVLLEGLPVVAEPLLKGELRVGQFPGSSSSFCNVRHGSWRVRPLDQGADVGRQGAHD